MASVSEMHAMRPPAILSPEVHTLFAAAPPQGDVEEAMTVSFGVGTDADIHVFNDSREELEFRAYDDHAMHTIPPGSTKISPGAIFSSHARVSFWNPSQSTFKVSFNGGYEVLADLGQKPNVTYLNPPSSGDGKVMALPAPGAPLTTGVDYTFFFYFGSGELTILVNSFIRANLPGIVAYLNKAKPSHQWEGVTFTYDLLDFTPDDCFCSYAAVVPPSSASEPYRLHLGMRITQGSIKGLASYGGQKVPLELSITDLQLMVEAEFRIQPVSFKLTLLQCWIGDITALSVLFDILKFIIPIPAAIMKIITSVALTPYRFAGLINTYLNETIRKKLDDAIASMLPKSTTMAESAVNGTLDLNKGRAVLQTGDYSVWMSAPMIQSRQLQHICIPGSHDAGAYDLATLLSDVQYADIAFLWTLSPNAAPTDGSYEIKFPATAQHPLFLGSQLYEYILNPIVKSVAQAGDATIRQQLDGGIRWFDLRIFSDTSGQFYMQHGLRGPSLQTILTQVAEYIQAVDQQRHARELIFLDLSHANYDNEKAAQVAQIVSQCIPAGSLYYDDHYDPKTFGTKVLKDIVGDRTRVMICNGDDSVKYPAPIHNGSAYGGQAMLTSLGWAQTPVTEDIIPNVLDWLCGKQVKLLQHIATAKNGSLKEALEHDSKPHNVTTLDWFTFSTGDLPVPLILAQNK